MSAESCENLARCIFVISQTSVSGFALDSFDALNELKDARSDAEFYSESEYQDREAL